MNIRWLTDKASSKVQIAEAKKEAIEEFPITNKEDLTWQKRTMQS